MALSDIISEVFAAAAPKVDDLASVAGVSRATLYAWRNGTRNPSPENLARLADALERRGGELQRLAESLRKAAEKL